MMTDEKYFFGTNDVRLARKERESNIINFKLT